MRNFNESDHCSLQNLNEKEWHYLSAGVNKEGGWDKGGGVSETLTNITERTNRGSKDSKGFIFHVILHPVKCWCGKTSFTNIRKDKIKSKKSVLKSGKYG